MNKSSDLPALSPIEDVITAARNGQMFILVDEADRENEGDLIIPAQFATPGAVNFMAKEGRGLICLAITSARAGQLGLRMMAERNETPHQTAFTVSVEAREGVSTGISAHDRAHTISVAIDPTKGAADLVSPGHVFPLVGRDGGVLMRAGHTEAAIDIARLAGLQPAGVICEIMSDDGSMARLPELIAFAKRHGDMKIAAISDLIAFRQRHDCYVDRIREGQFTGPGGHPFRLIIYRNQLDGVEHLALVSGRIGPETVPLVRMHKMEIFADVLHETPGRQGLIDRALTLIAADPQGGVLVMLRDPNPQALSLHLAGRDDGARPLPGVDVHRDIGVGAQILRDLGVRSLRLLSSSPSKYVGLDGYGLRVETRLPL